MTDPNSSRDEVRFSSCSAIPPERARRIERFIHEREILPVGRQDDLSSDDGQVASRSYRKVGQRSFAIREGHPGRLAEARRPEREDVDIGSTAASVVSICNVREEHRARKQGPEQQAEHGRGAVQGEERRRERRIEGEAGE